jgi:hypothetical protein
VRLVFQGIRHTLSAAPEQKNPAITAEIRTMVETLYLDTASGARDRALPLVDFAGAFRRSELVSLEVTDATFTADGLVVQLRRSKTDLAVRLSGGQDPPTDNSGDLRHGSVKDLLRWTRARTRAATDARS